MSSYFEPGRGNATKKINGKTVRGGYRYDFELFGQRHRSPRGFDTKQESDDAEAALRRRLKLEKAGVAVLPPSSTSPKFGNWGGVYSAWVHSRHKLGLLKAPEAIDVNISSVLRFFGARPTKAGDYVHPTAPYHNLTLADPIAAPSWIRRFDEWLETEGLAGGTRNHYNTTLRRMYWLAMQAEYRDESGAPPYNPFQDRPRYKWKRRTATLTPDQIVAWISRASFHTRIALSIATLNPKFQLQNILQLEWTDVNFEHRLIRVWTTRTTTAARRSSRRCRRSSSRSSSTPGPGTPTRRA